MLLEIIVTSVQEAKMAAAAGADRLELVAAFERGGLTPDLRIADEVVGAVAIPVHAIVREHDRGFVYDAETCASHVRAALELGRLGVAAIVFGALDMNGMPDLAATRAVMDASKKPVTFHRAFDDARDIFAAFDRLADEPRVTRVLTSGGGGSAGNAAEGRLLLRELARRRGPIVLAGGGITAQNLGALVNETRVRELHVGMGARSNGRLDSGKIARLAELSNGLT